MSKPATFDIDITQGQTFRMELTLDVAGVPINLAGAAFAGQVRRVAADPAVLAEFAWDITDAAAGEVQVSLTTNQTAALPAGRLVYDWWMTSSSAVVTPLTAGAAMVLARVTR